MKIGNAANVAPEMIKGNNRISAGSYYAEIFIEDSACGPVYHWTVWKLASSALVVLGEQSTYDIARQEAEHHMMALAESDNAANFQAHALGA
jgi:hypothetical protein